MPERILPILPCRSIDDVGPFCAAPSGRRAPVPRDRSGGDSVRGEPEEGRLARSLRNVLVIGESREDYAQAARILDTALRSAGSEPAVAPARTLVGAF